MDNIHNSLYTYLVQNGNMSSASLSGTTPVQSITVYTVQADWTGFNGDSTALITVSASNNGKVYTTIDSIVPTGATNSYMLNVEKCGYRFVQVAYTSTAGAGTINITISGKII